MNITKQDILDVLTYEKFEEYLSGKNPRGIAGECGNGFKCAISNFLMESLPVENYRYRTSISFIMIKNCFGLSSHKILTIPTKSWVIDFIVLFDATGNNRVTNSRALKILQSIKP